MSAPKYTKGTFVVVPNATRLVGLHPHAQVIYMRLCKFVDEEWQCFPSISTLVEYTGVSRRNVVFYLGLLCDIGLIQKEARYNNGSQSSNVYTLPLLENIPYPPRAADAQGGAGAAQGGVQELHTELNTLLTQDIILSTNVDNNNNGHEVRMDTETTPPSLEQEISNDSPPPVPPTPSPKRKWSYEDHIAIDAALQDLEEYVDQLWLAYDAAEQKKYMHHILTAKEFGLFAEKLRMERIELAKNVILVSTKLRYLRGGVCAWPKAVYLRYRDVYNAAKTARAESKPQWVYIA